MSTATEDKPKTGGSEIAKRAGDILPVMHTAAAAIGLETLRRIQHDAAHRTAEDYRFQNDFMRKVNGLDATPQQPATAPESESAMGDLIVVGEMNLGGKQEMDEALKMLKGKVLDQTSKPVAQEEQPQVAQQGSNTLGKLAAAAILAGTGGIAGVGSAIVLDYLNKPEPPAVAQPVDTDTDTTATIGIKRD